MLKFLYLTNIVVYLNNKLKQNKDENYLQRSNKRN